MPSNTTVTVENIRALLRSTYFRATFSLNLPAAHPSQQAHHHGPDGQLAITLGKPPTQCQTTTTIPIFGMASRPHILYLIHQHLSPVSALSLSPTCKSLSALASCHGGGAYNPQHPRPRGIPPPSREGRRPYALLLPPLLHPPPLLVLRALRPRQNLVSMTAAVGLLFSFMEAPSPSATTTSIRLAMNRHLSGPPNGLPLCKFNLQLGSFFPGPPPHLLSRATVRQDPAGRRRLLPVCLSRGPLTDMT